MELYSGPAEAKGVKLTAVLPEMLLPEHEGDPLRIRQILTNLIGNAIKFTMQGRITLHVTADEDSVSTTTVCLHVQDTGIGIEPAVKEKLFNAVHASRRLYHTKVWRNGTRAGHREATGPFDGWDDGRGKRARARSTFWCTMQRKKPATITLFAKAG